MLSIWNVLIFMVWQAAQSVSLGLIITIDALIRWTAPPPPLHFHFKLRPLVRNQKKWRVHPIINFVTPPYTRFIRILLCPSHLHLRRCLSLCMHVPQVGWLVGWLVDFNRESRQRVREVGRNGKTYSRSTARETRGLDWRLQQSGIVFSTSSHSGHSQLVI